MLYSVLLERFWIHANMVVFSTLHSCMKYCDDQGEVLHQLRKNNLSRDTIRYKDVLETSDKPAEENHDSGNKADSDPEPPKNKDFDYEINPIIISLGKLNITDAANKGGEWVINEDIDFARVPTIASDSVIILKDCCVHVA